MSRGIWLSGITSNRMTTIRRGTGTPVGVVGTDIPHHLLLDPWGWRTEQVSRKTSSERSATVRAVGSLDHTTANCRAVRVPVAPGPATGTTRTSPPASPAAAAGATDGLVRK